MLIYSRGNNYKVSDNLVFDNVDTGGTGASAGIFFARCLGEPVRIEKWAELDSKDTKIRAKAIEEIGNLNPKTIEIHRKLRLTDLRESFTSEPQSLAANIQRRSAYHGS